MKVLFSSFQLKTCLLGFHQQTYSYITPWKPKVPHAVNQHKSAASKISVEWLNTQVVSPKQHCTVWHTIRTLPTTTVGSITSCTTERLLHNFYLLLMGTQKFCLRPRSWQDEKHLFPFVYRAQKLTIFLILLKNMTLSTWLILAVCKNACHIWTW